MKPYFKRLNAFAPLFMSALFFVVPLHAQSININTASAEELEDLPGIGAKTAKKIVNDRAENGRFSSVEDLSRVPGVSSKVIEKIDGMATVAPSNSVSGGLKGGFRGGAAKGPQKANQAISREKIKQAMRIFAREPSIREVQAAALDQSRASPEIFDGWLARQRLAGLMPRLTARFDYVYEDDLAERSQSAR